MARYPDPENVCGTGKGAQKMGAQSAFFGNESFMVRPEEGIQADDEQNQQQAFDPTSEGQIAMMFGSI